MVAVPQQEETPVINLMEALKQSVANAPRQPPGTSATRLAATNARTAGHHQAQGRPSSQSRQPLILLLARKVIPMKLPLHIRFGRSTSCRYSEAVRLAAGLPGYRTEGEGRAIVHEVQLDVSLADSATWSRVQKLLQTIGMWASADIQANGEPCIASDLPWKVARIRACYADKQRRRGPRLLLCRHADGDAHVFGCHQCTVCREAKNVPIWDQELVVRVRQAVARALIVPCR